MPVPIADRQYRPLPTGKVKIGDVDERGNMRALPTFRFVSADQTAIEQIAAVYGGTPSRQQHAKAAQGQWQVTTTRDEIPVLLPPDPLGEPRYELYGGKGMERVCDGATCELVKLGDTRPCVCNSAEFQAEAASVREQIENHRGNGRPPRMPAECSPKTRLSVMLPDTRTGLWVFESKSDLVFDSMRASVARIDALQSANVTNDLTVAALAIVAKTSSGGSRKYTLAELRTTMTPREIVTGRANLRYLTTADPAVGELPPGARAALQSGAEDPGPPAARQALAQQGDGNSPPPPPPDDEDSVVDAEVVESAPTPPAVAGVRGDERMPLPGEDDWIEPDAAHVASLRAKVLSRGIVGRQMVAFLTHYYGVDRLDRMSGDWLEELAEQCDTDEEAFHAEVCRTAASSGVRDTPAPVG